MKTLSSAQAQSRTRWILNQSCAVHSGIGNYQHAKDQWRTCFGFRVVERNLDRNQNHVSVTMRRCVQETQRHLAERPLQRHATMCSGEPFTSERNKSTYKHIDRGADPASTHPYIMYLVWPKTLLIFPCFNTVDNITLHMGIRQDDQSSFLPLLNYLQGGFSFVPIAILNLDVLV